MVGTITTRKVATDTGVGILIVVTVSSMRIVIVTSAIVVIYTVLL
jgi:hypothetical protein